MLSWIKKNSSLKKEILSIILKKFVDERKYIDLIRLKLDFEDYEPIIDKLLEEHLCYQNNNQLHIDLKGFLYIDSPETRKIREDVDKVIPILRQKFKDSPNSRQIVANLADEAGLSLRDASMAVHWLQSFIQVVGSGSNDGIFYSEFEIRDGIRKFKNFNEGVEVQDKWRKSHKVFFMVRWLPWIKEHIFQIITVLMGLVSLYGIYFLKK